MAPAKTTQNPMNPKMSSSPPRVLLLYCADPESIAQQKLLRMPTGLYFIAAVLDLHGIPVRVENFSTLPQSAREEYLTSYRPKYIGLSMMTINRFATLALAKDAKRLLPQAKVVVGGPHASAVPEGILNHAPAIDCVVCGEGDETFLDLVRCWETGGDPASMKGVVLRKEGRVRRNEPRELISDLNALPHPARSFPYEEMSTSRGCPFQCAFCSSSQYWGRKIRYHSSLWVVDEIEYLYKNHGIREISINDDLFTADRERVLEICKEIVQRKLYIRFKCMSRVNTLCPDRLRWLKRAGCYRIDFGVESGSKKILKAMGKNTSPEQAIRAFEMTRTAGIGTGCFIIVGFPGENDASIQATRRLIRKLKPNYLSLSSMSVFPGSPVHRDLLEKKQVDPDIWFKWKEHTILFVEDGDHDRHRSHLARLREDYATHEVEYGFSLKDLEAILDRYAGLGHAAFDFSSLLEKDNRLQDALRILTQAVTIEPKNPFLWHYMSEICLKLGEIKVGYQAVDKALALQPGNYTSLRLKARLAGRSGELDRAHEELSTAIHSRPDKIEAYIEQGELYQKQQRYEQAITSYTLARRIDPYWQPLNDSLKECETQMNRQVWSAAG